MRPIRPNQALSGCLGSFAVGSRELHNFMPATSGLGHSGPAENPYTSTYAAAGHRSSTNFNGGT